MDMSKSVFREMGKCRKAKFGFEASVNSESFLAIAEAVKFSRQLDPELIFEVAGYTSHNYAKVYTNDIHAADVMREYVYPVVD